MRLWRIEGDGLLAGALAALLAGALSAQTAIGNADWGMTQTKVMAAESGKPASVREISGETAIGYNTLQFGGLPAGWFTSVQTASSRAPNSCSTRSTAT